MTIKTWKERLELHGLGSGVRSVDAAKDDEIDELRAELAALKAQEPESEQAVFEAWLDRVRPSGDHEAVQYQWACSSDLADFLAAGAQAVPAGMQLVPAELLKNAAKSINSFLSGHDSYRFDARVLHEIETTLAAAKGEQS